MRGSFHPFSLGWGVEFANRWSLLYFRIILNAERKPKKAAPFASFIGQECIDGGSRTRI